MPTPEDYKQINQGVAKGYHLLHDWLKFRGDLPVNQSLAGRACPASSESQVPLAKETA
jgi:hypothetical protein